MTTTKVAQGRTHILLALAAFFLLSNIADLRADDEFDDIVASCATCHGEDGIPISKEVPVIWGQNEGYMYLQLRDFKRGFRKNEIMQPIVADMDRKQLRAIANYFTKLKWPDLQQPEPKPDEVKKAKTAIVAMSCTVCHQGEFEGDGTTGRVAGQSYDYLVKTAKDFSDGSRANNPGMANIFKSMKPDDINALSKYLANMRLQPSAGRR